MKIYQGKIHSVGTSHTYRMKKVFPEADADMKKLFSAAHAVAGREVPGGTGFNEVRRQLDKWTELFGIK